MCTCSCVCVCVNGVNEQQRVAPRSAVSCERTDNSHRLWLHFQQPLLLHPSCTFSGSNLGWDMPTLLHYDKNTKFEFFCIKHSVSCTEGAVLWWGLHQSQTCCTTNCKCLHIHICILLNHTCILRACVCMCVYLLLKSQICLQFIENSVLLRVLWPYFYWNFIISCECAYPLRHEIHSMWRHLSIRANTYLLGNWYSFEFLRENRLSKLEGKLEACYTNTLRTKNIFAGLSTPVHTHIYIFN